MTALPPTPTLETERLILRPLAMGDVPAIQHRFPQWAVVKWLNPAIPWPYPPDGAETNVVQGLAEMARGEKLHWSIVLKGGPDELIGRIDLWPDDGKSRDMRGFWLDPEFWGRGLMTEAAERVTAYAFEDLDWPYLYLSNAEPNGGSHRVKEKQGAVVVDRIETEFRSGPATRVVWRLGRDAWLARRRGAAADGA